MATHVLLAALAVVGILLVIAIERALVGRRLDRQLRVVTLDDERGLGPSSRERAEASDIGDA
jgi:hypothetical protein